MRLAWRALGCPCGVIVLGDGMNVRGAALIMATVLPGVGLLAVFARGANLFSDQSWIYRYQTLIGAVVALLAAYIAVRPVWRQLKYIKFQSSAMYRDFVDRRLSEIHERYKIVSEFVSGDLDNFERKIYEVEELGIGKYDIEWLFESGQNLYFVVVNMESYKSKRLDPLFIEDKVQNIIESIRFLVDRLEAAHRPHTAEQFGEDYAISDEDWAQIEKEGALAEEQIIGAASKVRRDFNDLRASFEFEINRMRTSLRSIDQELIKASPL
ncbi:hypothetical protein G5B46_19295 [Caulobacter sp. 602-2]|uniref:Uncharacterized protein n=1 Tax=Caulobacter sp. 602-2 TaxID=2710887 RepID=A0A6G4R2G2_9CAUL|nr:hypothetical protein [Caulobacter sp. 602-2]NGM51764.1 hypothetical protein [Caulobacter sp. 602-2]